MNDKSTLIFVIEINGKSVLAFNADSPLDRFRLLQGIRTFNLHPHLPQLERIGEAVIKLDAPLLGFGGDELAEVGGLGMAGD